MKILAVYGSNYGQTEAVLRRVTEALEADGHVVSVLKGDAVPATTAVGDFDAAVIAASIRMGRYQTYMRDFAKRHSAALNALPTAFISVNGTRPESSPEWHADAKKYVGEFLEQTAWEPRWTASFAGKLQYRSYGPITRWIMRSITRSRGGPTDTSQDYEYTDWNAVDRFAKDLTGALGGQGE
jgi:menaquinone-dependent protoporphyrinogen oxidase